MKRVTIATIKSFIRKNRENLQIRCESRFDGMSDMVEYDHDSQFKPAAETDHCVDNTLGIAGAWFVGRSRDYFQRIDNDTHTGFHIFNACGSFDLVVKS